MVTTPTTNDSKTIIWYCHHYAGAPGLGPVLRHFHFCQLWNQNHCNAAVIVGSNHHQLYQQPTQEKTVDSQTISSVQYITLKTTPYHKNGFLRCWNMIQYTFRLLTNHRKIAGITGKPDVVIASSGHIFHVVTAYLIAKWYRAKFIFEVLDMWPDSLIEVLKLSKYNPIILLISAIERFAYRASHKTVTPLPGSLDLMKARGLKEEKFFCAPNGFLNKEGEQSLPEDIVTLIHQKRNDGCFLIGYAGTMGEAQNLGVLVEAMALLQTQGRGKIHGFLIGQGSQKSALQTYIENHRLKNLTLLDPIEQSYIPNFLTRMDALFVGLRDLPLFQYGIACKKIPEYMLSKKPIISAMNLNYNPVEAANCGVITSPSNVEQLAKTIEKISHQDEESRLEMGENGFAFAQKHYDLHSIARGYYRNVTE